MTSDRVCRLWMRARRFALSGVARCSTFAAAIAAKSFCQRPRCAPMQGQSSAAKHRLRAEVAFDVHRGVPSVPVWKISPGPSRRRPRERHQSPAAAGTGMFLSKTCIERNRSISRTMKASLLASSPALRPGELCCAVRLGDAPLAGPACSTACCPGSFRSRFSTWSAA